LTTILHYNNVTSLNLQKSCKNLLTQSHFKDAATEGFREPPVSFQELEAKLLGFFFPQRDGTAAFATLIFTLIFPERMLGECETDLKLLLARRSTN